MSKSKLTLIIDGNWLLMSRMSVLQNRYADDDKMCKDLKLMMVRSINIVLRQFTEIDNIIFVSDGGSWRNKIPLPSFLEEEYKGNREKDEAVDWDLLFNAYEDLLVKLRTAGITVCKESNIEGDDWIWYWSTKLNSEGTNVMIWSKDKDLTQLINVDKDCCFTVCWNKDTGITTVHRDEEDMDFFFNEAYSENEQIYHSIIDKAKLLNEINPKAIVVDKIIRGDKSDNVLPIILKKPKKSNGKEKLYRVATKDIDFDLDYDNEEDIRHYLYQLLNSPKYKDMVDKSYENVVEHFLYNKKLVALERSSYPQDILNIFEEYNDYKVSKDTSEVEYQLIAEANSISSILDIV